MNSDRIVTDQDVQGSRSEPAQALAPYRMGAGPCIYRQLPHGADKHADSRTVEREIGITVEGKRQ